MDIHVNGVILQLQHQRERIDIVIVIGYMVILEEMELMFMAIEGVDSIEQNFIRDGAPASSCIFQ